MSVFNRIRPAVPAKISDSTDESRNTPYPEPFNIDIPANWIGEDYKELKRSGSPLSVLVENISSFESYVVDTVQQMLEKRRRLIPSHRPAINPLFDLESGSKKIQRQALATIVHLFECLHKKDWFEDTLDFIAYNRRSFGDPATGATQYLQALLYLLKQLPPEEKLNKLCVHLQHALEISDLSDSERASELMNCFDEWWNSIPFHISSLNSIQSQYSVFKLVILGILTLSNFKRNRYSGEWEWNNFSLANLEDAFRNLTKQMMKHLLLITRPDSQDLTENDKTELGIRLAERKIKIEVGYSQGKEVGKSGFHQIWSEWLNDEKEFFNWLSSRTNLILSQDSSVSDLPADGKTLPDLTSRIIEGLNEYGFADYLIKKSFKPEDIFRLLISHSGREQLPYSIALFYAIGYIEYFIKEYHAGIKEKSFISMARIFNVNKRVIKGHVNILINENCLEDSTRFTSHNYLNTVQKQLEGLK